MAESYSPTPVRRIAQIITHRHPLSDAYPASSAFVEAKRISKEMGIVTLWAENAELKRKLERLK